MDLATSHWLLTAINGRIGRYLQTHLREVVRFLTVADTEVPERPTLNEQSLSFDVTDPGSIIQLLHECDGVIHLAGLSDEAPFQNLVRVNLEGTFNLLEAMRGAGVRRLVFASSNRVTGSHPGDTVLDDTSPVRPDGLYGVSKAAVEALTRLYSDKFGIVVCNMRIGSYEQQPSTRREAATWLSPGDALRAFETAMTAEGRFLTFYAI